MVDGHRMGWTAHILQVMQDPPQRQSIVAVGFGVLQLLFQLFQAQIRGLAHQMQLGEVIIGAIEVPVGKALPDWPPILFFCTVIHSLFQTGDPLQGLLYGGRWIATALGHGSFGDQAMGCCFHVVFPYQSVTSIAHSIGLVCGSMPFWPGFFRIVIQPLCGCQAG